MDSTPPTNPASLPPVNWKKWLIGSWSWKRPLFSLGFIYLVLALVGCFMADQLIFQPPGTPYPEDRRGFQVLGEDEEAIAIFHLAAGPGMPTLLWSHGNAQNLESLKPALEYFHLRGFGVISYDYPGYGESGGTPTEEGCYQAIERCYRHLCDEIEVAPSKVVLVGQSVGSGPTCWLAAREDHAAMVLISPFLSAFRTVTGIPMLPCDRFPNARFIRKIATPLLIIHGEDDDIIPFSHGQKLFELSPSEDKTLFPVFDTGHNDLFLRNQFNLPELIRDLLGEPSADPAR